MKKMISENVNPKSLFLCLMFRRKNRVSPVMNDNKQKFFQQYNTSHRVNANFQNSFIRVLICHESFKKKKFFRICFCRDFLACFLFYFKLFLSFVNC